MDDYKAMVLGTEPRRKSAEPVQLRKTEPPRPAPVSAKKKIAVLEDRIAKLGALVARVDEALADRDAFIAAPQKAAILAKQRGDLAKALETAEDEWLMLSAQQDAAQ